MFVKIEVSPTQDIHSSVIGQEISAAVLWLDKILAATIPLGKISAGASWLAKKV